MIQARSATAGQGFGAGIRRRDHDPARVVQRLAKETLEARGFKAGYDFTFALDGEVTVLSTRLKQALEQRRGQHRG